MVHTKPAGAKRSDGFFVGYGFLGETGMTILKQPTIKPIAAINAISSGIMTLSSRCAVVCLLLWIQEQALRLALRLSRLKIRFIHVLLKDFPDHAVAGNAPLFLIGKQSGVFFNSVNQ